LRGEVFRSWLHLARDDEGPASARRWMRGPETLRGIP
jgi:hypothetical protein